MNMEFGKIKKLSGNIDSNEWHEFIATHESLEPIPPRKGINPFTNEEVMYHAKDAAYYLENKEPVGNISLEEGELLTTGVPISICNEIAKKFSAEVYEDDRS